MARMASLVGGVLCLSAAVVMAAGGWFRPTPAVEGLEITPAVHDFGTVGQAELLTAVFAVKNNHRQTVQVSEMLKTCSCVQMATDARDLAPGQATTLRIGWHTRGKSGRVSDTIAVRYRVADQSHVHKVRVDANVLPDATPSPDVVRFGGARPPTQVVTIELRPGAPDLRVTTAHCVSDAVEATPSSDGRSVTLTYHATKAVPQAGKLTLLIKLTPGGQEWVEVPVHVEQTNLTIRSAVP